MYLRRFIESAPKDRFAILSFGFCRPLLYGKKTKLPRPFVPHISHLKTSFSRKSRKICLWQTSIIAKRSQNSTIQVCNTSISFWDAVFSHVLNVINKGTVHLYSVGIYLYNRVFYSGKLTYPPTIFLSFLHCV